MILPPIFPILARTSAVTSLIGTSPTRAWRHGYGKQAPEATEQYVTWSVITANPENTLGEAPRVDRHEIQIDCWGASGSKSVDALATAVRDAIEPYGHMTRIVADVIDDATQRPRIGLQFTYWLDR